VTREQAEVLARAGVADWHGSTLVMRRRGPPLEHGGVVVESLDAVPAMFSWPGWVRDADGSWNRSCGFAVG
jgi:hypothetical protein